LANFPQRTLKPVSNANRNTNERCRSNPRWNGIFRLNSASFLERMNRPPETLASSFWQGANNETEAPTSFIQE
jgi:hypothetical protein